MTHPAGRVRIWGIVPAAGFGRRMGFPKQVLPYRGTTMTAAVVTTLLDAGVDGVVVVTRSELLDRLQLPDDPRVRAAINDAAESEMLDSIRIGLASLAAAPGGCADGALVVPADMPKLDVATAAACVAAYRAEPGRIVIAAHGAIRGHPLIFPVALRGDVAQMSGGLRQLPQCRADLVRLIQVERAPAEDVDTPLDYGRL